MADSCVRCDSQSQDKRTLWLSCYYKLSELGIPFQARTLYDLSGKGPSDFTESRWVEDSPSTINVSDPKYFSTLSLCPSCRDSFMAVLKDWFVSGKATEQEPKREHKPWTDYGI